MIRVGVSIVGVGGSIVYSISMVVGGSVVSGMSLN